jgi:Domain of unknown function (DUF4055)
MAKDLKTFAHPEYMAHIQDWTKIRDCYDGERAIKNKGVDYLPRLTNQSQEDYDNYIKRALFFPITGKTVASMVGLATSKKPSYTAPDTMDFYFSDTDSAEYQFTEFYVALFNEVVLQGRYGVLIDAPSDVAGEPMPVAYRAENIINWSEDRGKLTMLLLRECVAVTDPQDKFAISMVTRYRHCFLDAAGFYAQEVLDEDLKNADGTILLPTFSNARIDYIPFTCIGSTGVHMGVDKPPMLDISTINISHYLTSADLEWGRHIVGLPTPVVSGADSSSVLKIGGTSAWVLPMAEAKAYYLEFQGQGLQSLEKAMTEKIGLMSTMSARLVDSSSKGSEAAEAVRLRYINEAASLIHIIGSIETGLTIVFNMLAKLRIEGPVEVTFPRDVLGATITFSDMKVLFEAYLTGSISKETLVYNLRRLDALDPKRTDQQELADIEDPPPPKTQTAGQPAGSAAQE